MAKPARKLSDIEPDIKPNLAPLSAAPALNDAESHPSKLNSGTVDEREANGSNVTQGPWKTDIASAGEGKKTDSGSGGFKNFIIKKAPGGSIGVVIICSLLGIGGLLSPGLLIVNIKEVMTEKFNVQLASMDVRTTKLLTKKMGTTTGLCTKAASVRCRYGTMSDKQIKKFKKAGIQVNTTDNKTLLGRKKPTSFQLIGSDGKLGEHIPANKFMAKIKVSPELRASIKKAYNPKYMGFVGKVWGKIKTKFKLKKSTAALDGKTDADKNKKVADITKEDTSMGDENFERVEEGDLKEDGTTWEGDELANENDARSKAKEMYDGAKPDVDETKKTGTKSTSRTLKSIGTGARITGWLDSACLVYKTVRTVGYGAKAIRALQLARYAMIFLNVADQIKAGEAKAEDVEYLGKILTKEVVSTKILEKTTGGIDNSRKKSATDSFGYQYAAYGKRGGMTETATKYLTGGGIVGATIKITDWIKSRIGDPKTVCKVLENKVISTLSTGAGIFTTIASFGVSTAIQLAADQVISRVIPYLQSLLTDMIAGVLVDENTVGEEAGDAITSGASNMMGATANMGGNAPLKADQAVAYANLTKEVIAQYAEEDRLAYSPFDVTNSNTFMGMIVSKLVPYASKMSSLSGTISSIASITANSFNIIASPITKAAEAEDYRQCDDFEYRENDVATDPFCNVAYGVTPETLSLDPVEVSDWMLQKGYINEDTGQAVPNSEYDKHIKNCIERGVPLGDDTSGKSDGTECFFDNNHPERKYFYVYHIDQRVQAGMDDEDKEESVGGSGSSSGNGTVDPGDSSQPENTKSYDSGWTLKEAADNNGETVDYTNVPCGSGTSEAKPIDWSDHTGKQYDEGDANGNYTHPNGFKIKLCKVEGTTLVVNSLISTRVANMIKAAKNDPNSVVLKGETWDGGGGFRTYNHQSDDVSMAENPENWATPGKSQHERGLALDFILIDDGGNEVSNSNREGGKLTTQYKWLSEHAKDYGFYVLSSEPWHWSTSGH